MVAGIEFHRGNRKLRLGRQEINESIEFPEDFEFSNSKKEKKFIKSFIDDVTRFGEKVETKTRKIYENATTRITKWVISENSEDENSIVTLNVFSFSEPLQNLRTALIQCNFTDVGRLITDFRLKMLEMCGEDDRGVTDLVITEANSIHGVIDQITAKSKCHNDTDSLLVLIVRQFESLRPKFLDSLISLIYSNTAARSMIPRLRLVVCLSTSPAFFNQSCSMDTLNLLRLERFQFTKLDDIFDAIITTGIHSHFEPPRGKPKSIEDDDPSLLESNDCAPAVFSGPFLKYLRSRFFACDYSVTALVRAVQFAFLRHYLQDPLWREEPNKEPLRKYDVVLDAFRKEFWLGTAVNLHIEVQSDGKFWEKMKDNEEFLYRKQFLFDSKSRGNLVEFIDRLKEDVRKVDENWCWKMEELMGKLEESSLAPVVETPSTPKTPGRISAMDFRKQQQLAMTAKQNNPVRCAKSAVFSHVMHLFETTLLPYPKKWRNVIDGHIWNEQNIVKTSLDASDEADIEKCLLVDPTNAKLSISMAWRALLSHRNFKIVPMDDWAREFLSKNKKIDRETAKGAFFAAAGLLEHIGLIRGAADRKSTNVNVQYHPITCVPDY